MKAILTRLEDDGKQTLGLFQVFDGTFREFECKTLELAWKDNQRQISCIPAGSYMVKKHNSPTFGQVFKVQNVPDRSEILIHKGNYLHNTKGCILVGQDFADIDKNGTMDVTYSANTFNKLMAVMPDEFNLLIV